MQPEQSSSTATYRDFRERGWRAVEAGRLEEAFDCFDRAWDCARSSGDGALADVAYCNRSWVALQLGRDDGVLAGLREVLLRRRADEVAFLAPYNIALIYELRREHKKGLFYARSAMQAATELGRRDWLASSYNQLGNFLLAENRTREAVEAYERALEHLDGATDTFRHAQIQDNLGYCLCLEGRLQQALPLLYRSARLLRRLGARRALTDTYLDLCFAHLEGGRLDLARRNGLKALELAQGLGLREKEKNALYLVGEEALLSGDPDRARGYFTRLEGHFPETPYLVDFLLHVDIRGMINLKA